MTKMRTSEAPGLLRVRRRNGFEFYWSASRANKTKAAEKYTPRTLRLDGTTDEARAAKCRLLTNELEAWLAGRDRASSATFDGTIKSLNMVYEKHPDSPFHDVRHSTRGDYEDGAKVLIDAVGDRRVDAVTGADLRRWHKKLKKPAAKGETPRLRRAQGAMKALRRIVSWGLSLKLPGCADLHAILAEMRFTMPAAREFAPTYEQVVAYIAHAHAQGRPSLAMAAALQYDCAMRLYDVIGQWEPAKGRKADGGYFHGKKRWAGGVLWSDLKDGVLVKKSTKTGAKLQFRIADCPLLSKEIERVPLERRIGPMVIDEVTARPYRIRWYHTLYRRTAAKADIPAQVWARDMRAGAITEAFDAGAETEQVRQTAGHSDPKITGRYNRGSTLQTSNVSSLRAALRSKNGK